MCAWHPGITFPGTEQESEHFVDQFQKRFEKLPNSTTMHGYTSARALLAAIRHATDKGLEPDRKAVRDALRTLDLTLPMGRVSFDENGDPRHYNQVIVQIQKGRMVPVYPGDRATGKVLKAPDDS
jgi:branched-chain amino acid transport system substrate-binding protein